MFRFNKPRIKVLLILGTITILLSTSNHGIPSALGQGRSNCRPEEVAKRQLVRQEVFKNCGDERTRIGKVGTGNPEDVMYDCCQKVENGFCTEH